MLPPAVVEKVPTLAAASDSESPLSGSLSLASRPFIALGAMPTLDWAAKDSFTALGASLTSLTLTVIAAVSLSTGAPSSVTVMVRLNVVGGVSKSSPGGLFKVIAPVLGLIANVVLVLPAVIA